MYLLGAATHNDKLAENLQNPKGVPHMQQGAEVKIKGKDAFPANTLTFSAAEDTYITFPDGAEIAKISPARKPEPGEDPMPSPRPSAR